MTGPVVEIILPTNRSSKYLPATLETVVRQTWSNWRLTVIDDGSPDPAALANLVAGVPGARLMRQPAKGVSAARNLGLTAASGPLVTFLDDDDLWMPERLEKQVTAWVGAPQHVGVSCSGGYIDGLGQPIGESWSTEQETSESLLRGVAPLPLFGTLLLTTTVCRAVRGFDETLTSGEDLDFTLKILQRGELLALPEPLMQYRRHATNVSREGDISARKAIRIFLMRQVHAAEARGDDASADLLREHLDRRRPTEAVESVQGLITAFRDRDVKTFLRELGWAARAPTTSVRYLASRAAAKWLSAATSRGRSE